MTTLNQLLSLAASFALATASGGELRGRSLGENTPCPTDCVLAQWTFQTAVTECSSCVPKNSKWLCPNQGNKYDSALKGQNGVGLTSGKWSTEQCVHKSYEPSFFAFAGPGEYEADVVPACPTAQYCACGDMKEKMVQLLSDRKSLPDGEKNDLYWAGMAQSFDLYPSFDQVSGASWAQYDLTYTHGDGRVQFCSGVQSFTYGPQESEGTRQSRPEGYTSSCAFSPSCTTGFTASGGFRGDCWPTRSKVKCTAEVSERVEALPGQDHVKPLNLQDPFLSEWSTCSKKCNGGKRHKYCFRIATAADATCSGTTEEDCNPQGCLSWVGSYEWMPSCPSGYEWVSTKWNWWAKRQFTCRESE